MPRAVQHPDTFSVCGDGCAIAAGWIDVVGAIGVRGVIGASGVIGVGGAEFIETYQPIQVTLSGMCENAPRRKIFCLQMPTIRWPTEIQQEGGVLT